jgi:imidazoleglycerol phosphate dehydratase HisB
MTQGEIATHRIGSWTKSYHGFPVSVSVDLDGDGTCKIQTGLGMFDHVLTLFGRYALCDLDICCEGDTAVDDHHTVDEVAIALGTAIHRAMGSREGKIRRYGAATIPMDECLTTAAVDFCGRSASNIHVEFRREHIGQLSTEMIPEFFSLFCQKVPMTLIAKSEFGANDHHKVEGLFKAVGVAFSIAKQSF